MVVWEIWTVMAEHGVNDSCVPICTYICNMETFAHVQLRTELIKERFRNNKDTKWILKIMSGLGYAHESRRVCVYSLTIMFQILNLAHLGFYGPILWKYEINNR